MTTHPALQDVPARRRPSPRLRPDLPALILDTATPLDQALHPDVADHFLALPRVEVVTAALTTFAPEDDAGWVHLGQRAWVTEWLRPGTACSILPRPAPGPRQH